jgi:hypothetical protein
MRASFIPPALLRDRVLEAAASHRRSLRNPPKSVEDYLDVPLQQGLPETVGLLRGMVVAL